jgi:hypothetical protein
MPDERPPSLDAEEAPADAVVLDLTVDESLPPVRAFAGQQMSQAPQVRLAQQRPPAHSYQPQPAPLELEAVVDSNRPHPLRFGIKAMFGIMLLCGVQFALIYYLGALLGLFLGAVACLVAITGLLVAAMVYRPRGASAALDYMDQLAIRLTLALVVLLIAFIVAGGGTFAWQEVAKLERNAKLRGDLGFTARHDSPFNGNDTLPSLVIETVAPGKPFDQAGLRKDDAILVDESVDIYELLEENRGRQVTLNVATVGSGVVYVLGPERAVTVSIPAAR